MRVLLAVAVILVVPQLGEAQCRLEAGGNGLRVSIDVPGELPIEAELDGSVPLVLEPGRARDGLRLRVLGTLDFTARLVADQPIWVVAPESRDLGAAGQGWDRIFMEAIRVDERGLWARAPSQSEVGPFDCSGLRLDDVPARDDVERLGYAKAVLWGETQSRRGCIQSRRGGHVRASVRHHHALVRSSPTGLPWARLRFGAEVRGIEPRCGWVQLGKLAGLVNCDLMDRSWIWLGDVHFPP